MYVLYDTYLGPWQATLACISSNASATRDGEMRRRESGSSGKPYSVRRMANGWRDLGEDRCAIFSRPYVVFDIADVTVRTYNPRTRPLTLLVMEGR